LKKSDQKTFVPAGCGDLVAKARKTESLFASFSSEKEVRAFLNSSCAKHAFGKAPMEAPTADIDLPSVLSSLNMCTMSVHAPQRSLKGIRAVSVL